MKTLVTGGAGFIGSHLVDLLIAENHEVTVLDNFSTGRPNNLAYVADQVRLIQCDLSIEGSWQDEFQGVDWVFHLAALADIVPSIQQPKAYFKSNVDGTFNILQAAKERGISKFIYAASSSCYGIPDQYPTPETAPIRPQYPYALTKRLGEELVMHWAQVYELPTLSYSPANLTLYNNTASSDLPLNATLTGPGEITSWAIAPDLPNGLTFEPSNGTIWGIPTQRLTTTQFTVWANNSGGSTNASLNITVLHEAPMFTYSSYNLTLEQVQP